MQFKIKLYLCIKQNKETMTNLINLRAELINSVIISDHKQYGKDSATCKSQNWRNNIGLFVAHTLKPVATKIYK